MRRDSQARMAVILTAAGVIFLSACFLGPAGKEETLAGLLADPGPSPAELAGWKSYRNALFGLEIRHPDNYVVCRHGPGDDGMDHVSLRQDGRSEADCGGAVGLRIGFEMYRLGRGISKAFNGTYRKLSNSLTLDEIAETHRDDPRRPNIRRECERPEVGGRRTLVCTERAPGEAAGWTGGIFEVYAYAIVEKDNGDRILVRMSNDAGGTPYTGDRALRRDTIRVFRTLR